MLWLLSPRAATIEACVLRACAPSQEKASQLEACAPQQGGAPITTIRESLHAAKKTQHNQKQINNLKKRERD